MSRKPHFILPGVPQHVIQLKPVRHAPSSSMVILSTVFLMRVLVDLITAVSVGLILASFYTLGRVTKSQLDSAGTIVDFSTSAHLTKDEKLLLKELDQRVMIYVMRGLLSFGAAKGLLKKLSGLSGYEVLLLDLMDVSMIDTSTAMAIEEMINSNREAGCCVIVACNQENVIGLLHRLGIIDKLSDKRVFPARTAAIKCAKQRIAEMDAMRLSAFPDGE